MMFGKLICRFKGHKRGVLVNIAPHPIAGFNHTYHCPRCKRAKVYKKASGVR